MQNSISQHVQMPLHLPISSQYLFCSSWAMSPELVAACVCRYKCSKRSEAACARECKCAAFLGAKRVALCKKACQWRPLH